MIYGRDEPPRLPGLRKQVIETKEGTLELKKKNSRKNIPGGEKKKGTGVLQREKESFV